MDLSQKETEATVARLSRDANYADRLFSRASEWKGEATSRGQWCYAIGLQSITEYHQSRNKMRWVAGWKGERKGTYSTIFNSPQETLLDGLRQRAADDRTCRDSSRLDMHRAFQRMAGGERGAETRGEVDGSVPLMIGHVCFSGFSNLDSQGRSLGAVIITR